MKYLCFLNNCTYTCTHTSIVFRHSTPHILGLPSQFQRSLVQSVSRSLRLVNPLLRAQVAIHQKWRPHEVVDHSNTSLMGSSRLAQRTLLMKKKNTGLDGRNCCNRGIMIQNVKIQRGCVETKDSSKRQRACGVYVTERKEIKTTT